MNPFKKWKSKKYSNIISVGNGKFIVQLNDKYGVINNNDVNLINPTYKNLRLLDSNYFVFTSNTGREGLMNSVGKEILPAVYLEITKISEKLLNFPIEKLNEIKQLLVKIYGKTIIKKSDYNPIIKLLIHDKKNVSGSVNFVLLKDFEKYKWRF